MNKTAWMATCLVGVAVMCALAAVSTVMGGCEAQMELLNGNMAPMKCHWTFTADTLVGVLGAVLALAAMSCKDQSGRRAMGIAYVACALVAAAVPSTLGIGLCANPEMHCHATALYVWIICVLGVAVGVVQIVKSRPA